MSFDAFGKRRNVLTLAALTQSQYSALNALTTQGFTGHEMVDEAGIIHMGGRIYDPGLGRFLSADPIVSDLGNVQRLNRYSYVLNSPLSYTDPTGFDQCHPDDSTCIFGTITVIGTSSGGVSSTMVFGQGSGNYFQSGSSSAGGPANTPPAQSDPSVNGAATEEATPTPVAPPVSVVTKDGDPITTGTTPDVAIGTATATTQVIATAPPTVIPTTESSTDVMQTDMEVADVGGGWTGTLNAAQAALTGLGFAPVVGIGADLLNGLISVVRGDLFGASFSVLSALPIAGDALGAARLGALTYNAGKAGNRAPDFIVSPSGTVFPVPKGAQGPTAVVSPSGRQTGTAYTGGNGGLNGRVDTIRVMDPTPPRGNSPGYPNGYVKYENDLRQGVDPYSGKTLPNSQSHFPIN